MGWSLRVWKLKTIILLLTFCLWEDKLTTVPAKGRHLLPSNEGVSPCITWESYKESNELDKATKARIMKFKAEVKGPGTMHRVGDTLFRTLK